MPGNSCISLIKMLCGRAPSALGRFQEPPCWAVARTICARRRQVISQPEINDRSVPDCAAPQLERNHADELRLQRCGLNDRVDQTSDRQQVLIYCRRHNKAEQVGKECKQTPISKPCVAFVILNLINLNRPPCEGRLEGLKTALIQFGDVATAEPSMRWRR